jgi:hypothetical protein
MNTGSGLKMLNFLTTMHKDEDCMHFLRALAELMVKRVLHVWPPIQEVKITSASYCRRSVQLCIHLFTYSTGKPNTV